MDDRLVSEWQRTVRPPIQKLKRPQIKNIIELSESVSQFKWSKMGKLGQTLYPTDSPYGRPLKLLLSNKYLLIGTQSSEVLVFDTEHNLIHVLPGTGSLGGVSCMALNQRQTHLSIGFNNGAVALWDLESPPNNLPKRLFTTKPRNLNNQHELGSKIVFCKFLSSKTHTFISVDSKGIVIINKLGRSIINGYYCHTTKILGSYTTPVSVESVDLYEYTLSILTSELLEIVDLSNDEVKEVFALPRLSFDTVCESGCSNILHLPHASSLVYNWGDKLRLLKFGDDGVSMEKEAFYSDIDRLVLISDDILLAVTKSSLLFIKTSDLSLLSEEKLMPALNLVDLYACSGVILVMGKYEFYSLTITPWSDRLLGLLNNGQPNKAMELALAFTTVSGDLTLLGLPRGLRQRKEVIKETIGHLVNTSLKFGVQYDTNCLSSLVPAVLNAVVVIDPPLVEDIWDEFGSTIAGPMIVDNVIKMACNHQWSKLPPDLHKQVIIRGYSNLEVFYNINTENIDLDLAFRICEEHGLDETRIFLETTCLHEYFKPLTRTNHNMVYLAYALTGRIFPTGEPAKNADKIKLAIYSKLFLDDLDFNIVQTLIDEDEQSFFKALNEGFEDSLLNESHDITRQIIVNILLSSKIVTRGVYLSIFIAANYAKYKQYLIIPEHRLLNVLDSLISDASITTKMECQLGIMSLLSALKVPNTTEFELKLVNAGYTMVLTRILQREGKLCDLVSIKLNNNEHDIWGLLNQSAALNKAQTTTYIRSNFDLLSKENCDELATLVSKFGIDIWDCELSTKFLDCLYTNLMVNNDAKFIPPAGINTQYVQRLLQNGSKARLADLLANLFIKPDQLDLDVLQSVFVENECVDMLCTLLSRQQRYDEGLTYTLEYLSKLDTSQVSESEIKRFVDIGIDLCQRQDTQANWERLLECCLKFETTTSLRLVLDSISSSTSSVSKIVKIVANTIVAKKSKNSNKLLAIVRSDLKRQERVLQCFYKILHDEGHADLLKLLLERCQGYIVENGTECEVCGEVVVGIGIDVDAVYSEWKNRNLESYKSGGNPLVIFRCSHVYHLNCLSRMNGADTNATLRKCLICRDL